MVLSFLIINIIILNYYIEILKISFIYEIYEI